MVFRPTSALVDLRDWLQWWVWVSGANWRHPFGLDHPESPGNTAADCTYSPVVRVAYPDSTAYARWAEWRLLTEDEWEWGSMLPAPGARRPTRGVTRPFQTIN